MALIKSLVTSCLFLSLFLGSVGKALAQDLPQILFLSHIRGTECCDVGSVQHFAQQMAHFATNKTPAFFALRYDALTDQRFTQVIAKYQSTDLFKFGVMLEVTPQLAEDSGVEYHGDPDHWYQAQTAFLIGYSPADRIKLVDQIITAYQKVFPRQTPEFSTAWQVDTPTLNYLHDKYDLKIHQIAREQWGLDSYTLDGGPPHYPYLASRQWLFNPDFSDLNHIMILRHTLNDPLYSYGDRTSAFTAQPNDYAIDHKDFAYFERLLDQTIGQTHQPGFANLGLENSMDGKFHQEFFRQIDLVQSLAKQGKLEIVSDLDVLKTKFQDRPVTILANQDRINFSAEQVYWITTPEYRIRLHFSSGQVAITDLRVYSPSLEDPYTNQIAQNQGYLVNPYLINQGLTFPAATAPNRVQKFLNIPVINSFQATPAHDLNPPTQGLFLPPVTDLSSIKIPSQNTISYLSGDQFITLIFNQSTFEVKNASTQNIVFKHQTVPNHPVTFAPTRRGGELRWQVAEQKSLTTTWECQNQQCLFEFNLNPQLFSLMRELQYPFIFPEKIARPINRDKTIVYVHNRYAVANRNPVRIVVVPQDDQGFPTSSQQELVAATTPLATQIKIDPATTTREYQLVDVSHAQPTALQLTLTWDNLTLPPQTIYFAPNCKTNWQYCLTHPRQLWWYIRAIGEDKIRLKLLGEKQT